MAEKCKAKKASEAGDCLFCKFAKGEIEVAKIYEDKNVFVFLDINPCGELNGHTLVIPKKHYETILDCPEETLKETIAVVKKIAVAVQKVSGAEGINLVQNNGKAAGQFVPHIHFHIIPRKAGDGIYFDEKRRKAIPMELLETAKKIKETLQN